MERMQRFINFIFYQVWCRARKLDGYDLDSFDANPPLKEIMISFAYDHTATGVIVFKSSSIYFSEFRPARAKANSSV